MLGAKDPNFEESFTTTSGLYLHGVASSAPYSRRCSAAGLKWAAAHRCSAWGGMNAATDITAMTPIGGVVACDAAMQQLLRAMLRCHLKFPCWGYWERKSIFSTH